MTEEWRPNPEGDLDSEHFCSSTDVSVVTQVDWKTPWPPEPYQKQTRHLPFALSNLSLSEQRRALYYSI